MKGFDFYEFFAGAGMARLGLGEQWSCLWANDFSDKKAEVYTQNFGSDHFVLEDVAKITASQLPPNGALAWASFPCQDLSLAGNGGGITAERSGTFWAFWRIMRDLYDKKRRPPIIVLENVTGLLSKQDDFNALCKALAALGLQYGAMVIDAKHFIPQSRPRVFVVAVDAQIDCKDFYYEGQPKKSMWYNDSVERAYNGLNDELKAGWRWWNLPDYAGDVTPIDEIIEDKPVGVEWNSPEETLKLIGLMTDTNREKLDAAKRDHLKKIGFLYKRTRGGIQRAEVRFDGIAGCLRTPKGGSSRQSIVVVENGEVRSRLLSPRELARLMGVPDTYKLPNEYNKAYMAMGDGVAVPAVAWLADHLLTPLAKKLTSIKQTKRSASLVGLDDYRNSAELFARKWGEVKNAQ